MCGFGRGDWEAVPPLHGKHGRRPKQNCVCIFGFFSLHAIKYLALVMYSHVALVACKRKITKRKEEPKEKPRPTQKSFTGSLCSSSASVSACEAYAYAFSSGASSSRCQTARLPASPRLLEAAAGQAHSHCATPRSAASTPPTARASPTLVSRPPPKQTKRARYSLSRRSKNAPGKAH